MSGYGAPGGPAPPGGSSGGYGPPSDPWGDEQAWDSAASQSAYAPYHPGPGWSEGPPPPPYVPRRRYLGLFIALGLAVMVAAAGVATTVYLASGGARESTRATSAAGGAGGGTAPTPTSTPDNLGLAAGFAEVGDCLVNDGTDDAPQMRITLCDAEEDRVIYRVLARFDERVADDDGARRVCGSTDGYRYHYYFISDRRGESFVLCMTDRP